MTTILHLTDLHFGAEAAGAISARAQRTNTLSALRDTLAGLRHARRPDIVVVSGDIGWAGRETDYVAAAEWLRSVLDVLGLGPERLIVCPGNHDLDRTESEGMERPAVAERADQLLRVERFVQLSRPFAAFHAFAREMRISPFKLGTVENYLVGLRDLLDIRFVVANTAWFCRDGEDRGRLFVGLPQLEVMEAAGQLLRSAEYDRGDFTITVLHHPETWLADAELASYDIRPATYYYLAQRSHLLLSGHTHGGLEGPRKIGDGGLLFVGGASYDGGRYRNNVSLLKIDTTARSVERTPYEFDPRDYRWHEREANTYSVLRGVAAPREDRGDEPHHRLPIHKPPRNLPPRQPIFAGREAELRELHERLSQSDKVGITQQAAVHGYGGIGKTSIAIEYGWRHLEDYPGGVFFLSCDSDSPPPVAELASHLGLKDNETADDTALKVKAHLETGEPCLLILDNVRGAEPWRGREWGRYLPGEACRRLVTTRAESLPGVAMYPLQRLTPGDGLELLTLHRDDVKENAEAAATIVEWFDGLAVGLTLVGVYMAAQRRLSWREYVDHLERKDLGAVRQTERAVGHLPNYDARVDAVFDELLSSLPAEQLRALEYAGLLPEDQIYAPWVAELLERDQDLELPESPGYEECPGDSVLWALVSRQLLQARNEEELVVSLHRVLRRRVRERLAEAHMMERLVDRVTELAEWRGEGSHDAVTETVLRHELTPLAALSRELNSLGRIGAAAGLANNLITPLRDLGRFTEARALLEAFTSAERLDAWTAEDRAVLLSDLALVLQDLGELAEARRRIEQAIEIQERQFNLDYHSLATSYSHLALILQDLGQPAEARRWMEQAVEMDERHRDHDDPILAIHSSNFAIILHGLGELEAARERIERAIDIQEQHFELDHPTLATSYSNLAGILHDLGELDEARQRMEQVIEIQERHFDPDHPVLAISYSNSAVILKDLGELEEARRRMERTVEINERHFEPDHPKLATSYSNLAVLLKELGEPEEARRWIERTIEIDEQNFDPDHPSRATSYSGLALILRDLGELPDARRWMERAIEIQQRHFDPEHSSLATSYSNLALILKDLGELAGALRQMERAIEISERHFDPDHPTLAIGYNNLANVELASGNRDRACALLRRAKVILDKHFVPTHPYVTEVADGIEKACVTP